MEDVRLYNRALQDEEIQELAKHDVSAARIQSAHIVLAGNASRIDKFAATELQRCLVTALNWNVNITDEKQASPDESVIFVGSLDSDILGASGFPRTANEVALTLEDEGVCLKGDGKIVALVGKGPRGGLYAVYEFLEKVVGCHWPEPGREIVPHLSTLDLKIDRVHNPTFNYRGVALHGPCRNQFYHEIIDWLAKNR